MDYMVLILIPVIVLASITISSILKMNKKSKHNDIYSKAHNISYQSRFIKDKNHKDTDTDKLMVAETEEKFSNDMNLFIKNSFNTK